MAEVGEGVFEVEMKGENRAASSSGQDGWEGAVFLSGNGKAFVARIAGESRRYPFLNSQDVMTIKPGGKEGFLRSLLDSSFSPTEWIVRQDAAHAKSKTYERGEISRP